MCRSLKLLPLVNSAHYYVTNTTKCVPYYATSFHAKARVVLLIHLDMYENHVSAEYPSFMTLKIVKLQGLNGVSHTVRLLILDDMCIVEYALPTKKASLR